MAGPTTPVTPRTQQLCLEPPVRTGRSADSGYGSFETSPTRPAPKPRFDRKSLSLTARLEGLSLNSYDGNSSEESDSDKSCHYDLEPHDLGSSGLGHEKFATLPKTSRRRLSRTDSYPVLPDRKNTHHQHGSDNTGITGSRVSSLRALDRFVPMRDNATPGSSKLRTTRALGELTSSERLVRHNQDAPDPFFFKRRALPPSPSEARKAQRPSQSRTLLDLAASNQPDRRVVSNSIWAVGGMAPNQGAVDNGRGHLFASGTNAPMFNTQFPPSKPKAQEDVEKHEARLASAFEID